MTVLRPLTYISRAGKVVRSPSCQCFPSDVPPLCRNHVFPRMYESEKPRIASEDLLQVTRNVSKTPQMCMIRSSLSHHKCIENTLTRRGRLRVGDDGIPLKKREWRQLALQRGQNGVALTCVRETGRWHRDFRSARSADKSELERQGQSGWSKRGKDHRI